MVSIGGRKIADIRIGNSPIKEVRIGSDLVWQRVNDDDFLTFTAEEAGSTVQMFGTDDLERIPNPSLLVSTDGGHTWRDYSFSGGEYSYEEVDGEIIELESIGASVKFRAGQEGNKRFGDSTSGYRHFLFRMSGRIAASGNINSLLNEDYRSVTSLDYDDTFSSLFLNCSALTRAPALPANVLNNRCYGSMFAGCTSLIHPPKLPAENLSLNDAINCYSSMFNGCVSLIEAPELPASILSSGCYYRMFNGCRSLEIAPELPAAEFIRECYKEMFKGCSALKKSPKISGSVPAYHCCEGMFNTCTSLQEIFIGYRGEFSVDFGNWVSGVSANGTFHYNGTDTTRGASAIPEGWEVVPYED